MCFKRNGTGLGLRQPDSGHEDPIGIEAVLEDPVILIAQFGACPLARHDRLNAVVQNRSTGSEKTYPMPRSLWIMRGAFGSISNLRRSRKT